MKKLILGLFVLLVGIINFGYCDYLNGLQFITNVIYNGNDLYQTTPLQLGFPTSEGLFCFNVNNWGGSDRLVIGRNGTYGYSMRFQTDKSFGIKLFGCFQKGGGTDNIPVYIGSENFNSIPSFDIDFYFIPTSSYNIVSGNPGYTIQQCQTEYGLISPNDVSTEIKFIESEYESTSYYLGYNKLATINLNGNSYTTSQIGGNYTFNIQENQGGQCTGSVITGNNWSALYINDLQFPGKSSIFVNIPDYITWDYSSTENDFTINVGSGYDQDYIDSIISINSYHPDSNDFTDIFVSGLTLIFPYIVITLFIVFVWRLLKRIFR